MNCVPVVWYWLILVLLDAGKMQEPAEWEVQAQRKQQSIKSMDP